MQKKDRKGAICIFSAGILWGVIGPLMRLMQGVGCSITTVAFLRVLFAFAIMLISTVAIYGVKALRMSKKNLFYSALMGLVCHGIYNIFYSSSVKFSGVAVSAVMLNTAPIFTAAASVLLFHERLNGRKIAALIINILGCTLASGLTGGKFSLIGILCGLGAGFCYAMTAIIGKYLDGEVNLSAVSAYGYLTAAIFLAFPFSLSGGMEEISNSALFYGFLAGLIPTALAYLLYYIGVRKVSEPSKIPVIASSETASAVLIGVFFMNESMSAAKIIGLIAIFISIIITGTEKKGAAPD